MTPRSEAKLKGEKFYPSTCKRCGDCFRRVDSGACCECAKARRKRVYHLNKVVSEEVTFVNFCKKCDKDTHHYLSNRNCKPCSNYNSLKHYSNNREKYVKKFKKEYLENREERKSKNIDWYNKNKSSLKIYFKKYRTENKEKIALWRKSESAMKAHRDRQNKKYKTTEGKAVMAARNMVYRVMKGYRCGKASSLLGYSTEQLVSHIESQFTKGMTWDNYGDWHIDHIIPVSFLVSNSIDDVSLINSLKNLMPLWAYDNISKHANYEGTIEDALIFLEAI